MSSNYKSKFMALISISLLLKDHSLQLSENPNFFSETFLPSPGQLILLWHLRCSAVWVETPVQGTLDVEFKSKWNTFSLLDADFPFWTSVKLCESWQNLSRFESDLLRRSRKGENFALEFISMFFKACICSALISAHLFLLSSLCLFVWSRFVSLVRTFKNMNTRVAIKKLVPAIFISVLSLELLDAIFKSCVFVSETTGVAVKYSVFRTWADDDTYFQNSLYTFCKYVFCIRWELHFWEKVRAIRGFLMKTLKNISHKGPLTIKGNCYTLG